MQIYEGTENYIFISYSHKDSATVMPIVQGLANANFRVWYDAGIEAGSEWPENVATHIAKSNVVLVFLSKNALDSDNCTREIHYSIKKRKKMLVIYLEDLELSEGMDMQLSPIQAMFLNKYIDTELFIDTLLTTSILQSCKAPINKETQQVPTPQTTQASVIPANDLVGMSPTTPTSATIPSPTTPTSSTTPTSATIPRRTLFSFFEDFFDDLFIYWEDWVNVFAGLLIFASLGVGIFGLLTWIFQWNIPWIVWQWIIGVLGGGWLTLGIGYLIYLLDDDIIVDFYISGFVVLFVVTLANVILFLCLRDSYRIMFSCFSVWSIIGGIILAVASFDNVEPECGVGYIGASILLLVLMVIFLSVL